MKYSLILALFSSLIVCVKFIIFITKNINSLFKTIETIATNILEKYKYMWKKNVING